MTDPSYSAKVGPVTMILPTTARIVKLYKRAIAAGVSMEEGTTDYVVPTGKKLWILHVYQVCTTTAAVTTVKKHTVADTNAGTAIDTIVNPAVNVAIEYDTFISVEAGKYINLDSTDGATYVYVTGIELDV